MLSFRPSRWRLLQLGWRGPLTLVCAVLVAASLAPSAGASPFQRTRGAEPETEAPKKKEKKKTKAEFSRDLLLEIRKHTVRRARIDALALIFLEEGEIDKFHYVEQLRAREDGRFERERVAYREELGGKAFDKAIESLRAPKEPVVAQGRARAQRGAARERDVTVADARDARAAGAEGAGRVEAPQDAQRPARPAKSAATNAKPAQRAGSGDGRANATRKDAARPPAKRPAKDGGRGRDGRDARSADPPPARPERPAKERPTRASDAETNSRAKR